MSTDDNNAKPPKPEDTPNAEEAREAARHAAEASGIPLTDWLTQLVKEASVEEVRPETTRAGSAPAALNTEVRQAAEQAAAAAGVPMSAWLGQLLKEASLEEAGETAPAESTQAPEPKAVDKSDTGEAQPQPAPNSLQAAAEQAAAAAGVPVGAWLSALVEETSRGELAGASEPGQADSAPSLPLRRVAVSDLKPGHFQMRATIDPMEISSLAASIKSRGVLQPIIVRARADGASSYEIIAGERRWRAAQEAGLSDVPVLVLDVPDRDAMEIALVENLQRHDLSPLEEAEGYRRLVEELGETQDSLARVIGKSRSHVSNTLRLLRLPESVKSLLAAGKLSAGHARAILSSPDPEGLAKHVVESALSVRDTEQLAQGEPAKSIAGARGQTEKDPDLEQIEAELSRLFGVVVKIALRGAGDRGKLTIQFKGLDKLHELIERLRT